MAQTKKGNASLRMSWDASTKPVESIQEAITAAKAIGLGWFYIDEWDWKREAWMQLGYWARDHTGRFVSIPASEQ